MSSRNLNSRILAIDIGATNTRLAIFDSKLHIIRSTKSETPRSGLISSIKIMAENLCQQDTIDSVAISVAGPVDKDGSVVLTNVSRRLSLHENDFMELSKHVFIINDATAAAYYEARGNNSEDLVYVTISSGIGVGAVKGGEIVRFYTVKDELGHLEIPSDFNQACGCGGKNHWESFSAGLNIPTFYAAWRESKELSPVHMDVQEIFMAAEQTESEAHEFIVNVIGPTNSFALLTIIERYKPEIIVLGGPVILANRELFTAGLDARISNQTKLLFTNHDDEVCLLGAAAFAMDKLG